jgi:hypothetical protein
MCTTLGFIALAAAALVVARRRAPENTSFSSPGYPFTAVLFVLLVLSVVVLVAINRPLQAFAGFAIILLGLRRTGCWAFVRARGREPEMLAPANPSRLDLYDQHQPVSESDGSRAALTSGHRCGSLVSEH